MMRHNNAVITLKNFKMFDNVQNEYYINIAFIRFTLKIISIKFQYHKNTDILYFNDDEKKYLLVYDSVSLILENNFLCIYKCEHGNNES